VTDKDGKYVLSNLPDDNYIVEFLPPDGTVAKASQQFTLRAGQQKTGVDAVLDLSS
jgi:hypothetical protein